MSRPTRSERRRALLARRLGSLEVMEARSLITESLGVLTAGIGLAEALPARRRGPGVVEVMPIARPRPVEVPDQTASWGRTDPVAAGPASIVPVTAARPVLIENSADWLALHPQRDTARLTAPPANTKPTDPGTLAARGSAAAEPAIVPLRLPPPMAADADASSTAVVAPGIGALSASFAPHGNPVGSPAAASPAGPSGGAGSGLHRVDPIGTSGGTSLTLTGAASQGNSSGAALASFTYFPLYTLDYYDGTVFFPNTTQLATLKGYVDLRAQVRDATVSSYSWDTSLLSGATNITGTNSYRLRFQWTNTRAQASTSSVTLTVTDNNGHSEVQTYSFLVPAGNLPPSSGGGAPSTNWPETLAPNTVLDRAPQFDTHYVSVDANGGALDVTLPLPAYSPNLPALALTYDSLVADPRPIVVEHHVLDDSQSVPTQVSGQLTFNGSAGTTYYYDTSQFIPGDVQQMSFQADATALATGRYSYSVAVGDIRGSTTTSTASGTLTVLNGASHPFGAGWTLRGLGKITAATGGVILDLGMDGRSLWFTSAGGSGGGYTSPAGDFSTLAPVSGGGYTRTMPDGVVYRFDSGGRQTSVADRNGLRVTFAYDGSGKLTTITDPYSKITTFAYDGSNKLQTITDPASRVTTIAHSGSNLTGVTLPDSAAWSYAYDGSGRLTQATDPRSKTVTVAYDSTQRVGTITRPDATTETFASYQARGWTNSGTSGSPAAATLLAEARASHADPNGHVTDVRPDWYGLGLLGQATDPDGNVATFDRTSTGLATVAIDRLNRVNQYAYDAKGNVTRLTYPDFNAEQYTYNTFSEPTSHTNPRNKTTTYTYDGNGNLTGVQDPLSNRTTLTYTGNGRVATVQDARSNVTSYQYDSQDRVTTVTHPDSSTNLIAYDGRGNAASVTDGRGNATTYSYDALNRVTGTTDALTNRTTLTYDASGNLTVIQAPLARTTTVAYDAMNRATTVTDPLSHSTVYGYDSGGNLRTVTDPLARVTTLSYDAEDRRTVLTDPLGNRTTTAYDAEGQVLTVTDPLSRVTTYTYKDRGWVATLTDPLGNTTTYSYSATGKPSAQSSGGSSNAYTYDDDDRLLTVADGLGHVTSFSYDAVGNRIAVTDANSHTVTYAYDSRNRLTTITDALSHATVYGYDSGGNRTTVTDALGHATTTQYDALNRATTMTDARGAVTALLYDAAGRNTVVVDPNGNRTTFAFDAADRLTTMTDPLSNNATYAYDAADQMTEKTDRNLRRTTYSYDSGGRRTGETWVGASPSEVVTYTYDAAGQMTGAVDANARLTFAYDSGGRPTTAATSGTAGQPSVTLTSSYDALGQRTQLVDNLSSQGITTYSYDNAQRLTQINRTYGGANGPKVVYGYDDGNRLTSRTRTIGSGGTAVTTSYAYDAADRLTTMTHQVAGGSVLATYVYGYDDANRVTSEQNAEGTVSYTYDVADQLTGATGSRTESYSYDSGGNRTMSGYTIGAGNQLTASPGYTYTYDAEGNMVGRTDTASHVATTYTYDQRNRLTNVTEGGTLVATYTYDALDRRIGFQESGTQTWVVWDGQNPYADFDGSGTLEVRYVYGPALDELLARTDSGGTSAWYLTDRQGTVRDVADTSGGVIDHVVYDSYGTVTGESNSGNGDRFKFTGREWDTAVGLYFYRARWYGPSTGRFISNDPLGFDAEDANLYRYVHNRPTNYIDPTGEADFPVDYPNNSRVLSDWFTKWIPLPSNYPKENLQAYYEIARSRMLADAKLYQESMAKGLEDKAKQYAMNVARQLMRANRCAAEIKAMTAAAAGSVDAYLSQFMLMVLPPDYKYKLSHDPNDLWL